MVLSGWKEIAAYLRIGIRTAQRWESGGLPVSRPFPGRRSHVVADSADLDLWLRHSVAWRKHDSDLLLRLERTRKLRADVRQARQILHEKMEALRKEAKAVRTVAEQLNNMPRRRNSDLERIRGTRFIPGKS